ncbi:MAG: hypothetical protein P8L44_13615 [Opitutales bacterium]|nr:hypothetical protein [Opitutales bacterium]
MAFIKFTNPVAGFWWGSAISSFVAAKCMAYGIRRESPDKKHIEMPETEVQKQANSNGAAMLVASIANSV